MCVPTHPLMMCEEILEINLSQIFTLQAYMLLKERWDPG